MFKRQIRLSTVLKQNALLILLLLTGYAVHAMESYDRLYEMILANCALSSEPFNADLFNMLVDNELLGGFNINQANKNEYILLHYAAIGGNESIVKKLLSAHADVNKINYEGNTPLHFAARNGNTEVLTLLLTAGAKVNIKNNEDETPLHKAAGYDHINAMRKLLAVGAHQCIKNKEGKTVLEVALTTSSKLLLKKHLACWLRMVLPQLPLDIRKVVAHHVC